MAKQSALDKALANLDEKIAALQLARQALVEQQYLAKQPKVVKPRTKPRPVKVEDRSA
jgi:multidrug efflux pump subunit AcrA (membrane-fusion protein)